MSKFLDALRDFASIIVNCTKKLIAFAVNGLRKIAMIIGRFFTVLTQWIDKAMNYVIATFKVIVSGVQVFLKKVGDQYQEISYNYTQQQDGSFIRNTVVRQSYVSESEIPDDIKQIAAKMQEGNLVDISQNTAERQEKACKTLQIS